MTKYLIEFTNSFKRNYKLMMKRGYPKEKLEKVIDLLAEGKTLPQKYRDHMLGGNYIGYRECHIEPNWLLIYKRNDTVLVLTLTQTGTHSDLFDK